MKALEWNLEQYLLIEGCRVEGRCDADELVLLFPKECRDGAGASPARN